MFPNPTVYYYGLEEHPSFYIWDMYRWRACILQSPCNRFQLACHSDWLVAGRCLTVVWPTRSRKISSLARLLLEIIWRLFKEENQLLFLQWDQLRNNSILPPTQWFHVISLLPNIISHQLILYNLDFYIFPIHKNTALLSDRVNFKAISFYQPCQDKPNFSRTPFPLLLPGLITHTHFRVLTYILRSPALLEVMLGTSEAILMLS